MFKKLAALLAGAALMMAAGSAFAIPLNVRPAPIGVGDGPTLQAILDTNFNSSITATTGQSNVGAWTQTEGDTSAYRVAFIAGDTGFLSIYSLTNPTLTASLLAREGGVTQGNFLINSAGTLTVNLGATTIANFGQAFGFFWTDTDANPDTKSYTEDDKNLSNEVLALSYRIAHGTQLTGDLGTQLGSGATAGNNNDWVLAFEDIPGGDHDYNDAVIYVEDMSAVPEPGTMVLLGAGLLGLAIFGKRRMNQA